MPENINEHFGIAPGQAAAPVYVPRPADDVAKEVESLKAQVATLAAAVARKEPKGLAQRIVAELRQRLPAMDRALHQLTFKVDDIYRRLARIHPVTPSSGGVAHGNVTSPTTLGSNVEGSETADSTSWTWTNGGPPVEVWMQSRTVYNESGDQKLYEYFRKWTIDTQGFVYSISGETRVIVDTPV
jgi:hypothetical protein